MACFRRQVLAVLSICVICVFLLSHRKGHLDQVGLEGVLFLTKNLFRELKELLFARTSREDNKGLKKSSYTRDYDHVGIEYPFSNVMNLIFPLDSKVLYNTSNETREFLARYASFSPIIDYNIKSGFGIIDNLACAPLNHSDYPQLKDKVVVVMRGNCSFVQKITHLVDSGLNPRAILVANNIRNQGLVTMYSASFNQDGSLSTPILFISYESFEQLGKLNSSVDLQIAAVALDGWINLAISVMLSPPLVIMLIYGIIRCGQIVRRRHTSRENENLVRRLKVYIYNRNHLIPATDFYDYIRVTNQTEELEQAQNLSRQSSGSGSASSGSSPPPTPASDLPAMVRGLNILVPPEDYFNASKCSICLEKFHPLRSRVLLLNCKHFYHEQCLSNWLINFKRSCPLCNNSLKLSYLLNQSHLSYGALEESVGMTGGERAVERERSGSAPGMLLRIARIDEENGEHREGRQEPEPSRVSAETLAAISGMATSSTREIRSILPSTAMSDHLPNDTATPSQAAPSTAPRNSAASFVTAKSHLEQATGPAPQSAPSLTASRPRAFSRPSQLLSFSNLNNSVKELSGSIDSGDLE